MASGCCSSSGDPAGDNEITLPEIARKARKPSKPENHHYLVYENYIFLVVRKYLCPAAALGDQEGYKHCPHPAAKHRGSESSLEK